MNPVCNFSQETNCLEALRAVHTLFTQHLIQVPCWAVLLPLFLCILLWAIKKCEPCNTPSAVYIWEQQMQHYSDLCFRFTWALLVCFWNSSFSERLRILRIQILTVDFRDPRQHPESHCRDRKLLLPTQHILWFYTSKDKIVLLLLPSGKGENRLYWHLKANPFWNIK